MNFRALVRAAILRSPPARGLLQRCEQLTQQRNRAAEATLSLQTRLDALCAAYDRLGAELESERRFVPAGHFYSPVPSPAEIERDAARLFAAPPRTLPGIDLREPAQLALLDALQPFYAELPWSARPGNGLRYGFDNGAFSFGDAIMLYAMLRHVRPRRMIEIGSGHSSCLTLDTNERFLDGALDTVFVEPYPELLQSLLRSGDTERVRIVPTRVQDVSPALFDTLAAGDILFIDSTHVGKIGSDVNYLLHEILPRLAPGVFVHVHDIFYPFEYPRFWLDEGRAWNEAYLLRCFLQFNETYEIVLWNSFLAYFHPERLHQMPLVMQNPGGSLWLRRR